MCVWLAKKCCCCQRFPLSPLGEKLFLLKGKVNEKNAALGGIFRDVVGQRIYAGGNGIDFRARPVPTCPTRQP